MTGEDEDGLAEALEEIDGRAASERRAAFLGLLNRSLPEDDDAILVGEGLVELLTEGQYGTGDLDLVGDEDAIAERLEAAGFEDGDRHFVHEELGLVVEVVAPQLDEDQAAERVRWGEFTLPTLSLEDLIVERLSAGRLWDSPADVEQARLVYATHRDRLDGDRLRSRADEEGVARLLEGLQADFGDADPELAELPPDLQDPELPADLEDAE